MRVISFVVLHYGDQNITYACVNSILALDQQERIRVVIVDNDSNAADDERDKLARIYQNNPRIAVLSMKKQRGFSYANNCGYRYAKEKQKVDCIILLNNDIEFPDGDFIRRLELSYTREHCHILSPDIVRRRDGEHQSPVDIRTRTKQEADNTIRLNRIALRYYSVLYPILRFKLNWDEKVSSQKRKKNVAYYTAKQEGIVPFGACLIFTPSFVKEQSEAFVPETEFYYEEYILAYRCQKMGYRIVYDPTMRVFHESGIATKKRNSSEWKRLYFIIERTLNACEIYRKLIDENE